MRTRADEIIDCDDFSLFPAKTQEVMEALYNYAKGLEYALECRGDSEITGWNKQFLPQKGCIIGKK